MLRFSRFLGTVARATKELSAEERARLAKKYNLIPEDYMQYPPSENYYGDYPYLKPFGGANRDLYEDYDDPVLQRNYGEPIHPDAELYFYERIDPQADEHDRFSTRTKFFVFFGFCAIWPTLQYLIDGLLKLRFDTKAKHRQFPKDGPHYTFD